MTITEYEKLAKYAEERGLRVGIDFVYMIVKVCYLGNDGRKYMYGIGFEVGFEDGKKAVDRIVDERDRVVSSV